jgi:nicotinamidase-related amidase
MTKALLVIDCQNDYFPGGRFPLWNAEGTLETLENAIHAAKRQGIPVVLVQHAAKGAPAFFFEAGTPGADLHPRIRAAAPEAPVVVKAAADAFHDTDLAATLRARGADELLVCGMMTQNCVTHTVLSRAAGTLAVTVLTDACTTVSEILHLIALNALSTRVALATAAQALG